MRSLTRWGVVVAALVALVGYSNPAQALHHNATVPAGSKCLAGKIKCVIKKKACLLGLYKKSFSPDPLAINKCIGKFDTNPSNGKGCFAKLEAKGGCLTTDDSGVIEAKIDAYIKDLIAEMNPTGAGGINKCSNGKVGCVLKYNSCILGLYAKKTKNGGSVSFADATKCRDGLTKCIGKLELKYGEVCVGGSEDGESCVPDNGQACVTGGGSCVAGATPCRTEGDLIQLRNKDDAFIDDMIAELVTDPDMDTQRCSGDTKVKCTSAPGGVAGCGGPLGLCQFYFGAPLPLAAGGVATCVTNQWVGSVVGTFNQQTGHSSGTANLLSVVYNGIDISTPCPRCVGDPTPNHPTSLGVCDGGMHDTLPCDVNGQSPEPTFGDTSLDCPPLGPIASVPIDLSNTTGVFTQTVTATSPNCNGAPGDKCLCASCTEDSQKPCRSNADCIGTCSNPAGAARQATPCVDESSTPMVDESLCAPTGVPGEGECPIAPVTQKCLNQTFRSCTNDVDCTATLNADPTDSCGTFGRECFPNYNGQVLATISAIGGVGFPVNGPPVNGYTPQTFASVFCVAPTSAPGVNAAAGLPGPGRLELGGVGFENGTPTTCPTLATFLPTSLGSVLDIGWTGIAHDAKVIEQGKVAVGVIGCTNPTPPCGICTYSGPIPNPNIAS